VTPPRLQKSEASRKNGDTVERIVDAARRCFEQYGIQKTTIGDIADAADVSRPTVYKNFASKNAIIDHISIIEIEKINVMLRRQMRHGADFADKLTEALLISINVARQNSYILWFIRDAELRARMQAPTHPVQIANRMRWRSLLHHAAETGELASDLDFDDVVFWLTLMQESLVFRTSASPLSDDDLRRCIKRFVVDPLLRRPTAGVTSVSKKGRRNSD